MLKICENCKEEKEHHGKGYCFNCYRKIVWKREKKICKRCKREKPMHAKGLCPGCYNFFFRLNYNKAWNYKKDHDIDIKTYKKFTKSCVLCGFDKVVELHHLDHNTKNNSENNLIGLCPNHHKMLHRFEYKKEILERLKEKGFNTHEDSKLGFSLE